MPVNIHSSPSSDLAVALDDASVLPRRDVANREEPALRSEAGPHEVRALLDALRSLHDPQARRRVVAAAAAEAARAGGQGPGRRNPHSDKASHKTN